MKAIGKGSLASILSAGLHVVRVVIFVMFFGLCVAAAVMPLASLIVATAERIAGHSIEAHIDIDTGDYVKLLRYFVTVGVMLYIVNRLLEILRTLRFGSPFVRENADRFKRVGFALLLGEAAKIIFGILGAIFDADVEIGTELTTWIAIVAVFVLAEVFLEGAKMKEEQDLTV
jgi:hypothetical protein